mmetsp:Transcript_40422/g.97418  ORF Transcript_40422/g.97418 Transcript_40422/m.97418 type:complete len:371 (-) Transcript_40422:266-1378(-)|eukprot:CAMPEP_0113463820 /NCGR_PEP_ID=MMETSP0014_2-20120614/12868_1 /TAXON_ID=2857 /ORGANISM="Nitzschia sp." /LENGTH=370 /DNA_ID=CAMNT_0000355853 /DNA_START=133 /DNA_END=1245 /DNA_ORIENTATION=- /assembly_acc=CAM_ASM_000159
MATGTARYIPELAAEYQVAEERPADIVYDFRDLGKNLPPTGQGLLGPDKDGVFTLKEVLAPNSIAKREGFEDAFVIPDVLSPKECLDLIEMAEHEGIRPPAKAAGTHRTAKRTSKYQNTTLSDKITSSKIGKVLQSRLSRQQQQQEEESISSNNKEDSGCSGESNTNKANHQEKYCGEFYGIHSNWRVVRYDCCCDCDSQKSGGGEGVGGGSGGDAFPAHQDQMDSIQIKNPTTGVKDFYVSTHTLLICLSPTHSFGGGATRFYPDAKVASTKTGQNYNHAIDVLLPQGWALVFPQLGLVHAGQPVVESSSNGSNGSSSSPSSSSSKYVAQAGVLRKLPPGRTIRPSLFRLGPGLAPSASVSSSSVTSSS